MNSLNYRRLSDFFWMVWANSQPCIRLSIHWIAVIIPLMHRMGIVLTKQLHKLLHKRQAAQGKGCMYPINQKKKLANCCSVAAKNKLVIIQGCSSFTINSNLKDKQTLNYILSFSRHSIHSN